MVRQRNVQNNMFASKARKPTILGVRIGQNKDKNGMVNCMTTLKKNYR